jgi:hypothetical protein
MRTVILCLLALLAGCAEQPLRAQLPKLVGQPISAATAMWGDPESTMNMASDHVYIWSISRSGFAPEHDAPALSHASNGVDALGSRLGAPAATSTCQVSLTADSTNIIRSFRVVGDQATCAHYASALR